jgi:F-box protein, helicase, 18
MHYNRFEPIDTKLNGVTFEGRQLVCAKLYEGARVLLVREPENIYDSNAIGVLFEGQKCGFIPKELSRELANWIDSGTNLEADVIGLNGGSDLSIGVNIHIEEKIENHGAKSSQKEIFQEDIRKWIEEEDEPEFMEGEAKSTFDLTDEQKEIVAHDLFGNSTMKIIAFAGTGKTATLVEYSKKRPNLQFLYVAFNKSVQMEAETKFPSNVTCKTSHSLAWAEFGAPHGHRLTKSLRPSTAKSVLGLDTYMEAKIVTETLLNFLISVDSKFSKIHVPSLSAQEKIRTPFYLEMAVKLWIMMCDPNNQDVGMLHDGYLKQYQLSKPQLNYDCILLDEAQDTNPAVTDIILSQHCPKILVGDPHQQIYAFRGAHDAMQKIEADKTFYLTHSFRFGEEIAWIANRILWFFKGETKELRAGCFQAEKKISDDFAIIARTNAELFDQAANYRSLKIAFLGGIDGYRFDDILDVYRLYAGKKSEICNKFILRFSTYDDLIAYAEEAEDIEIKSICKIITKHTHLIPVLIEEIKNASVDREISDLVLTTAHKAKGSEFSVIYITDDFPNFFPKDGQDKPTMAPDEANLLYVTATRAKKRIEFCGSMEWERFIS